MRLWCWPGAIFELGQLKVLVSPPERMAGLLELPEIVHFHTRYLYHGRLEFLFRVPPIVSEIFETAARDARRIHERCPVVVPHNADARVGPGDRGC